MGVSELCISMALLPTTEPPSPSTADMIGLFLSIFALIFKQAPLLCTGVRIPVCRLRGFASGEIELISHEKTAALLNEGWTRLNERTFIAVKPDGVQRKLVGEIVRRFEKRGFKLVGLKLVKVSEDLLREHYCDLRNKPFFSRLISYMSSGPVVAMVWQGLDVVKTARKMIGETNPADSLPGTVRGDYCVEVGKNMIHGSDSVESAQKEISLWFRKNELQRWESSSTDWIY